MHQLSFSSNSPASLHSQFLYHLVFTTSSSPSHMDFVIVLVNDGIVEPFVRIGGDKFLLSSNKTSFTLYWANLS